MSYFRVLLLLTSLGLLQTACQKTTPPLEGEAAAGEEPDFDTFYELFHSDSLYQMAHIQFPLQGVSSRPEDHGTGFRWEKEDWRIHRSFDASSSFRSEFTSLGDDLVIENIIHKNGQYGMERRFSRLGGDEWYLIYYAALHPL
jgi:hypothetical protein